MILSLGFFFLYKLGLFIHFPFFILYPYYYVSFLSYILSEAGKDC